MKARAGSGVRLRLRACSIPGKASPPGATPWPAVWPRDARVRHAAGLGGQVVTGAKASWFSFDQRARTSPACLQRRRLATSGAAR
jgi:hypothetical protein